MPLTTNSGIIPQFRNMLLVASGLISHLRAVWHVAGCQRSWSDVSPIDFPVVLSIDITHKLQNKAWPQYSPVQYLTHGQICEDAGRTGEVPFFC